MGLIDDITANGRGRAVALVGLLTCVFVLAGFSFFRYVVQDDVLVGNGQPIEFRLRDQKSQIDDLRARIEENTAIIENGKRQAAQAEVIAREAETAAQDVTVRTLTLEKLQEDTHKLRESLKDYQQTYREQTWQAAVGEKIPSLVLKSGKSYQGVTLTKVTPEGLQISHADGLARISPKDLDAAWQRRFDWPEEK